jgi:hypothetical protein
MNHDADSKIEIMECWSNRKVISAAPEACIAVFDQDGATTKVQPNCFRFHD